MSDPLEAVAAAVRDGDRTAAADLVRSAVDDGATASEVLSEGLIPGMRALGERFKDGQAFLPEIFISVRAMQAGLDLLRPLLVESGAGGKGTVILGTVAGDLHDIGKTLVGTLLEGNGFHVVDLGVDVAAAAFVEAAQRHKADLIALSALLTTTTPQFRTVVEALQAAGLRGRVKVMVGGASVSRALANEVGAEGFADDCFGAVDVAEALIG